MEAVAQFGRALGLEPRGRRFDPCQPPRCYVSVMVARSLVPRVDQDQYLDIALWPSSSVWLERHPNKVLVGGSNPSWAKGLVAQFGQSGIPIGVRQRRFESFRVLDK